MAKIQNPRSRALSVVFLLAAAMALSACTAEQFWRSVYETGKNACQKHRSNCTDHTDDRTY